MRLQEKDIIRKPIQEGESIFAIMTPLANEYKAINMSQGFPDFQPDQHLLERVEFYLKNGNNNQYAPMPGVLALRQEISNKYKNLYNAEYDPQDEVTVCAGATQAIFTAISAFVCSGDEVIVFEPAFDTYVPTILLNGGIPKYVRLQEPEFYIDWDKVKELVNDKTRMIIINSPHNPCGSILSKEDIAELKKICAGTKILIMSDEVHEHVVFNENFISISEDKELYSRTLVLSSFGKTFSSTGWKMGYCCAPEPLSREIRKIHQNVVFACNHPVQLAIADHLKNPDHYTKLAGLYKEKRDYFLDQLEPSGFKAIRSAGTFFQLLDYSGISDESDVDFAIRLTKEFGIAAIPLSVFYHDNYDPKILRFCFAKQNETLKNAAEILCKI